MLFLCCSVLITKAQQRTYENPIIPGFYPDPSVCKVNDTYYLVNSSFEYFPAIPIWKTTDLIHWKQVGHVLTRTSQLNLANTKPSNGIYAPTIRYHEGIFYVVVTNVQGNKGYTNFYVTTTNPEGAWSDPIYYDQSGIDPSLFFDSDGKVYFQSNRATKPTDARAIYQSEIDIRTGKRLSDIKLIWKGSGGSYVEGPHIYNRNGWYYLLTAEGGTAYGHMVAIARSKNIWGPYESNPKNPILTNRMSYASLQGTGHADMIQANDSSWWLVHLAFRPAIDGIHFIGRETCLTPMRWHNDWPIVNDSGQAVILNKTIPSNYKPSTIKPFSTTVNTNFDTSFSMEWVYLRNPDSSNYDIHLRKGWLALRGNAFHLNDIANPTCILRRQQHFNFTATTTIDFSPNTSNEEAGMTLLMDNRFHYDFYVTQSGQNTVLELRYTLDSLEHVYKSIPLPKGNVTLIVKGDKRNYQFYYQLPYGKLVFVGTLNTRFLGTEVSGGYNGVMIGLYATGKGISATAPAFFDEFTYVPSN